MKNIIYCVMFAVLTDIVMSNCGICPRREVWVPCSSPCIPERTCQNQFPKPTSQVCILLCIQKCECDFNNGYIRNNATGKCVPFSQCPTHCTKDEVLNECGSSCIPEPTCQNPKPKPTSSACTLQCIPRCECNAKAGLIRDEISGQCVPREKCPEICGPNETLNPCASACVAEPSCYYRYPNGTGIPCQKNCVRRCECDKGYLRDPETGKCVSECPDKCGPNQYQGCEPCCQEATCYAPKPGPCNKICPLICYEACLCEEGYVRNVGTGECILEKDCRNQ